ncbi:MAG: hypothetical protein H7125_09870 [Proteobacteria bacterium]|nr:hypothetical protein [Burkholderiales bacterium]
MPTVQISLVREHTAAIRPPRALWVPFMLGRPLGVPGDAAFQGRVVRAALGLFERVRGPVLDDYPEDAPAVISTDEMEGMACPISFAGNVEPASLPGQVLEEIDQLRSWYDIAVARRGRTTLGAAGATVEDLTRFIGAWVGGDTPRPYRDDLPSANALRLACEEIKSFYFEADAGQPGVRSPQRVLQWFWRETAAGKLLVELQAAAARSDDPAVRHFAADNLVPRAASHGEA